MLVNYVYEFQKATSFRQETSALIVSLQTSVPSTFTTRILHYVPYNINRVVISLASDVIVCKAVYLLLGKAAMRKVRKEDCVNWREKASVGKVIKIVMAAFKVIT